MRAIPPIRVLRSVKRICRPLRFDAVKFVVGVGVILSATIFLSKEPAGTITGTIRTEAGIAVKNAKVIANASDGEAVASAMTDDDGRFEFPQLAPGVYTLEIDSSEGWKMMSKTVEVKAGEKTELNLIGNAPGKGVPSESNPLGKVSFYTDSNFQQGQLEDPSGGGGYSNGASAQARQMLKQYLVSAKSGVSASASKETGTPVAPADARNLDLERTGSTLLAQRDYTQAVQVFQKGIASDPQSERLQMGLGFALYGAGKYGEAAEALSEAARLAPDDPAPVVMLAEVLQFAPEPAAAALIRQFAELHPKSAQGHYAYGLSLWQDFRSRRDEDSLRRAEGEFQKAIVLDRSDPASHVQLGMIYDEKNLPGRAVLEYESAVRLSPDLAAAHYRLAQDYQRLGKKKKGVEELAKYQRLRGPASPR